MRQVLVTKKKKNEDVSREVTLATYFMLKELLKIFHNIEGAENRILEADLRISLERQFSKA